MQIYNEQQIKSLDYFNEITWKDEETPRYWYHEQAMVTHFFNALSLGIPESERFLVQTIKQVKPQVKCPKILKIIQHFVEDENSHSLQHTKFNHDLKRHGYPINGLLKVVRLGYKFIEKVFSFRMRLAIAVCLEHMTAMIAAYGFDNELMTENVSKVFDLFIWHGYEELSHRAAAYDVYTYVGGGTVRRCLAMLYITFFFMTGLSILQAIMILTDIIRQRRLKWKSIKELVLFYWGKKGLIWGCWRMYWDFFRPSFRP